MTPRHAQDGPRPRPRPARSKRPTLRVLPTTLWEYPSQHYDAPGSRMQGDKAYVGATPSWVIWQLLQRYTREGDLVLDPMCGSGTTLDVAEDLKRRAVGFDLSPTRPGITRADARALPMDDESVDFVFVDPPYSTHVEYSDDPRCIGRLDAGGPDRGREYYHEMARVIDECWRVLKDRRYMALYVSDSWRKRAKGGSGSPHGAGPHGAGPPGAGPPGAGEFMPIGFELFTILRRRFAPVDIICVVRHNRKLEQGNWRKAAEEGNFFLRGFNYLFIMKKDARLAAD